MRVFRAALPKWADTDFQLFSGEGAAIHPGRWNFPEERTVYCAESLEVALAEAGFYEIIFNLMQLRGGGVVAPRNFRALLLNRSRVLAVAEYDGIDSHLVDISTADKFADQCKKHRVRLTFEESRRSDYVTLSDQTRRLARGIRRMGAAGMITRSARFDGRCMVIFPNQIPSVVTRKTLDRADVLFSASDAGRIWSGRDVSRISAAEVVAVYKLAGGPTSQLVPVLALP